MIKMPLSLSMGKVVSYNPSTCEETIDHPILNVGSSFSFLKAEVRQWMSNRGHKYKFEFDGNEYCLWFETDQDLLLFTLRWL
jgi:hypothetical protein